MGKKTIAIPLILLLAASAAAVPFLTGGFDLGGSQSETGEASGSDASQTPSTPDASTEVRDPKRTDAPGGSPSSDVLVDDLLTAADPTSPAGGEIRSQLSTLTSTTNETVEPYPTPTPTTLYAATAAHPAHTQEDLHYVETLQPLPKDLDQALARIVLAHGVSTAKMATGAPNAALTAQVTMAAAMDTAMPTLERYIGHPIWDRQASDDADASTAELEVPPLPEALMGLYASLGYDQETLDAIEPAAQQAADQLGPEESQALARLVAAQKNVQKATASSLLFLSAPASHSGGQVGDATRTVDEAVEGTPLEQLTVATEQLRSAAQQARDTFHDSPAGEPVRDQPWVGPLGLIVVGTQGQDTFDGSLGGEPIVRDTASSADQTRSSVGETSVNTTDAGVPGAIASAEVGADVANGSTLPDPGWHMLVLDPGGNDTYVNNAGGIDAGNVLVQADVDADEAVSGTQKVLVRDGRVCTPVVGFCEPELPGGLPSVAFFLQQIDAEGPQADTGTVPTGLPLTAAVVDTGGSDDYEDTGPVIQGAARGLSVGLLYDAEGDDDYEATGIAQGASEQYGIGLLVDEAGDDSYSAERRAQGWANVPDPNATLPAETFGVDPPFIPEELRFQLVRTAEGSLIDTGGLDDYQLDDLLAGQGMVQVPTGFARIFAGFLAPTGERSAAQLVDVGGPEQLPIPEVQLTRDTVEMEPSRVNVSQEQPAHFWLSRRVPGDTGFFDATGTDRWKTAIHVDPDARPDPVGEDALRAGKVEVDCKEDERFESTNFLEAVACSSAATVDTPPLLLLGEPGQVEDPPALTLTFGGDTDYNGSIAAVDQPPSVNCCTIRFGGSSENGLLASNRLSPFVPRVLVDLAGDDSYVGGDGTIASANGFGSAMLVDRKGHDRMEADNRSIAYARTEGGCTPNCGGTVATVIDLDGDLEADAGNRSLSYASRFASGEPRYTDGAGHSPITALEPTMSLIAGGADTDRSPEAATEKTTAGLDLTSGNLSQAYSRGLGTALIVGSAGDDNYTVDGWGVGVHEANEQLAEFCKLNPEVSVGSTDVGATNIVSEELRPTHTFLGGVGMVLDPDGNDDYTLDTPVGLGDAFKMPHPCEGRQAEFALTGQTNVNFVGLGSLVDVRGQDDYRLDREVPRPADAGNRSCSGASEETCDPTDDRAWTTVDESQAAHTIAGDINGPGAVGLGVDNVRNAHHLAASSCRSYKTYNDSSAGFINGSRFSQANCKNAVFGLWEDTLGPITRGHLDVEQEAAGQHVEPNVPITRNPELDLTLPRPGVSVDQDARGPAEDQDDVLDRFPLGIDPSPGVEPDTAFLSEATQPQCEDTSEDGRTSGIAPNRGDDQACLSVSSDMSLGEWISQNPHRDHLDPGDTIGCNCSVSLEIEAAQGEPVDLLGASDQADGLYPRPIDFVSAQMLTHRSETWFDGFNRFRAPLEQPDGDVEGDELGTEFYSQRAAADFPLNLSEMPSGLATVAVHATVDDTVAEETGGLAPVVEETWTRTLIHERSFDEALVVDDQTDRQRFLVLSAPGPVDADVEPTLEVRPSAVEDAKNEFDDLEWEHDGQENFTRELPEGITVYDGTNSSVIPLQGAEGCAARLVAETPDGLAGCWTGDRFVLGLPLEDLEANAVETVRVDGHELPLEAITADDEEVEPRFETGLGDNEDPYEVNRVGEVWGLPGDHLITEGSEMVQDLLNREFDEKFAHLSVKPDHPNAIGTAPTTPNLTRTEDAAWIDSTDLCAANDEDCRVVGNASHEHYHDEEAHRAIGDGYADHPHVVVWTTTNPRFDVVEDGQLQEARATVIGCVNLNYASIEEARDAIRQTIDVMEDKSRNLNNGSCLVFTDGGETHYLVPYADEQETSLVRVGSEILRSDGRTEQVNLTGHVDPFGTRGQLFPDPASSRLPSTTVAVQATPQASEESRLTDDETDLVDLDLQVRNETTNWTSVGNVWDAFPTRDERFRVTEQVDFSRFVDSGETTELDLRAGFTDENNNTLFSPIRSFVVDRSPPEVENARVVSGADQDFLILRFDESLADQDRDGPSDPVGVQCAQEGCPLETQQRIPGAEPEPALALSQLQSGTQTVKVPLLDLQRGPTYNVTLTLTDKLNNTVERTIEVETFSPLEVDLSPMEGTLVNKTITLNWTSSTLGDQTISTFSSAYLMLPEGPCPVLKGSPGVVPAGQTNPREEGPVSVLGEAGETACDVPDAGTDAQLLLYALAPDLEALALDVVPVHVDTTAPTVNVTGTDGWTNATATVSASTEDALEPELELFIDGVPQGVEGASGTATVSEEGVHDVLARGTDAAGNVEVNRTTVRIDRTPPSVSAEVLGVRGGLALVNATATDQPSSVKDVQLFTRSSKGPVVPGIGGESVLLSVPVEADEDEIVLRARDQANNARDLRLSLEDVPRVESGPLVSDLQLSAPAPDTLSLSFDTSNETAPVLVVDAGDEHVERVLDLGRQHEATIEELPPGRQAEVTVTVPDGASLVPAVNATMRLPEDQMPPSKLSGVQAEPVEGGVQLSWDAAEDNVGVKEIVVERDGEEVARTSATTYTDEPRTFEEHTYTVAAVDRAGNRGPESQVEAKPIAQFAITNLTTTPETLTPEEPVTVRATVQTPAGLEPDVVTLTVGDREIPMQAADVGPYESTYEIHTRLPALNVTQADTELVVNASAGDRSETASFPAPVVSTTGTGDAGSPSTVPGFEIASSITLLAALALVRRRWCH